VKLQTRLALTRASAATVPLRRICRTWRWPTGHEGSPVVLRLPWFRQGKSAANRRLLWRFGYWLLVFATCGSRIPVLKPIVANSVSRSSSGATIWRQKPQALTQTPASGTVSPEPAQSPFFGTKSSRGSPWQTGPILNKRSSNPQHYLPLRSTIPVAVSLRAALLPRLRRFRQPLRPSLCPPVRSCPTPTSFRVQP